MTCRLPSTVLACAAGFLTMLVLLAAGCSNNPKAATTKTEVTLEPGVYNVDHPELFKLAKAETRELPTVLNANGSIAPDVNRTIHVTSQGSGRVTDLRVKLGDRVTKGQVLLSIYSSDLAGAFSDYQKALADERLSKRALDRAQLLFSHGALAQKDLDVAQDAEDKAKVDVQTAQHRVRLLGGDPDHPGSIIELRAPVSGTIVEQNVAGFEGVKSLDNSPNLFTIADLSQVWVLCDVYENDLGEVHLGDSAEIRLNAYSDHVFHGSVVDISRVLDPNTRAAKVRIVLPNPSGLLRPGMFAVATFRSRKLQSRMVVPGTAIMRLQDKDWVFHKEGPNRFRRMEVHAFGTTPDGFTELQDGLKPDEEVVANALEFSTAMAEQGK
ncbi:MAG TPA: efflux RND transporter periplasmic adaptor subunit [Terriglobales bacterium]|nr:efflux RND transporter periplasmic adaptor subunit [Terriglobales bacterium]